MKNPKPKAEGNVKRIEIKYRQKKLDPLIVPEG